MVLLIFLSFGSQYVYYKSRFFEMKQINKLIKNGQTYYLSDSALTQSVDTIAQTLNNLSVPDSTSDLTNDSGFLDSSDFKTINNQSVVGSGNIAIPSGVSVSSVTQSQYDALPSSAKTSDVIWIITDVNPSGGGSEYSAGTNIQISNNVISVTGITVPTNVSDLTNDSGYLVSNDLKTINSQSVVGSGNINIPSGVSVSSVTQSQYDALPSSAKTSDTVWIITDVNPSGGGSEYSAGTNIDITNNVISVTGITVPTKTSDLTNDSNFLTKSSADTLYAEIGDIPTNVGDLTNDEGYLTSSDFKTINNESIVGSGNIVIQGGSSSGVSVVEISQSDYNSLPSSAKTDSSKLYVISGATSNYYTKSEVNALIPTKTSDLNNDSNFVASTNLKTINNTSLVGSGNFVLPTFTYDSTTQTLNITTS